MPKSPQRPADPKQRWLTFVHNHAKAIIATDFFVVVTAPFKLGLRLRHHGSCKPTFNVTRHPTADWTLQQFRECIVGDEGYRFIIHDRDRIYSGDLDAAVKALGLTILKTPRKAPKA